MAVRLGRNPWGEWVEETHPGARRVATAQGWKSEGELPPVRFCRWTTPADTRLAIQSMGDGGILSSFGNQPLRAWTVWATPAGLETAQDPARQASQAATPPFPVPLAFAPFDLGVRKAWASQTLHRLSHHQGAATGPRWEWVMDTPLETAPLGLWRGLSCRIEAHHDDRHWWWEMGMVIGEEAATRRLPPATRRLLASSLSSNREAPHAERLAQWPKPPSAVSTFRPGRHGPVVVAREDPTHVLLWVTKDALARHGDPQAWWPWLSTHAGWVVFDQSPEAKLMERALGKVLAAARRIPERIVLQDGAGKPTHHLWHVLDQGQNGPVTPAIVSLPLFAGTPPVATLDVQGLPDDAGRVPYRPGNPEAHAEGVAPQRLEAAMHHALGLLWDNPEAVEASMESLLHLEPGTLHDHLSPEQVDAVLLARQSLHEGGGFVLSDETGFGKGRTIAALTRLGLNEGRTVVFVTENANLFSDLHRDLLATGLPILPTLLHQDALIRNQDGTPFARSVSGDAFKDLMKDKKWKEGEAKFIMTTYAQLGRASDETPQKKKGRSKTIKPGEKAISFDPADGKLAWLRARMGDGAWLLLDEAHNAAGNSQINERLEKLIKQSGGVVFASATYARKEDNLGVYTDALPIESWTRKLLHQALSNDDGILRETLTTAMAGAGRLVRREHPPVPPPEPLWVPVDDTMQATVTAFGDFWRHLFAAGELAMRMNGEAGGMVWLKLGGLLSRSVREFSMWAKADALIDFIEEKVRGGEKVVIALESTMESALKETLLDTHTSEDEGEDGAQTVVRTRLRLPNEPLWKDRWGKVLNEWIPDELIESARAMGSQFDEQLRAAVHGAREALARWPDWGLSPLDTVEKKLTARGIRSGELSGRQNQLVFDKDAWILSGRPKASTDRQALVRNFNSGQIDVIWVTRAGCAGISLHAGRLFADQRKRHLIEWDIPVNPANRIQFWGRVRRKDQVREPGFWGLALDIPMERRRLEREERKRKWLAAHAGTAGGEVPELPWLSPEGEQLVAEWAALYPKQARRIGIHMPQQDNPTGRIDRALLRAIVLPPTVQQNLWQHLETGLHWAKDSGALERAQLATHPSRIIRSRWWWGDPAGVEDGRLGPLDCPRVDLVERIWSPRGNPDLMRLKEAVTNARRENRSGAVLLESFQTLPIHLPEPEAVFASAHLGQLNPGTGFEFSRPGTGEVIRAMVLRVSDNPHQSPALSALSQFGIEVWATGEQDPWWLPLSFLAKDPMFKFLGKAKSEWFEVPPAPVIGLTLEGNALLAAAWGQRWNAGRATLIRDVGEGLRSVWALPRSWSWQDALNLPRDLLDVDHLLAFWREHPGEMAYAALPGDESWIAQPVQGGVAFRWTPAAYEVAKSRFLPFPVDRALSNVQRTREGAMERTIGWRDLPRLLHSWATLGIGWRIDAIHRDWHQKTAASRMQAGRKR